MKKVNPIGLNYRKDDMSNSYFDKDNINSLYLAGIKIKKLVLRI